MTKNFDHEDPNFEISNEKNNEKYSLVLVFAAKMILFCCSFKSIIF